MYSVLLQTDDVILCAIPGFFVCMAAEWFMENDAVPDKAAVYDRVDTLQSLMHGLTQYTLTKVVAPFGVYWAVYRAVGVGVGEHAWLGESRAGFVVLFIGLDWTYYWMHRLAHQVGWLWTGHAVHHSSRRFNFSTAIRQSWWQGLYDVAFYLPWALVVRPTTLLYAWRLGIIYQFWVHTCHIDRFPAIVELLLVTPSHHRVHHDARAHKNFGGTLIVWDRLFGTFLAEGERPACRFGLHTAPPDSDDVVLQRRSTSQTWWAKTKGPAWVSATFSDKPLPPPPEPDLAPSADNGTILLLTFLIGWYIVFLSSLPSVWALAVTHIGGVAAHFLLSAPAPTRS